MQPRPDWQPGGHFAGEVQLDEGQFTSHAHAPLQSIEGQSLKPQSTSHRLPPHTTLPAHEPGAVHCTATEPAPWQLRFAQESVPGQSIELAPGPHVTLVQVSGPHRRSHVAPPHVTSAHEPGPGHSTTQELAREQSIAPAHESVPKQSIAHGPVPQIRGPLHESGASHAMRQGTPSGQVAEVGPVMTHVPSVHVPGQTAAQDGAGPPSAPGPASVRPASAPGPASLRAGPASAEARATQPSSGEQTSPAPQALVSADRPHSPSRHTGAVHGGPVGQSALPRQLGSGHASGVSSVHSGLTHRPPRHSVAVGFDGSGQRTPRQLRVISTVNARGPFTCAARVRATSSVPVGSARRTVR